ncbi:MAG: hypothetical protein KAI38_06595, partial [Candidatus Latescibacteria bacterium]|nr:hypothetical protein [Candidatus Latescibacterota bacterium]
LAIFEIFEMLYELLAIFTSSHNTSRKSSWYSEVLEGSTIRLGQFWQSLKFLKSWQWGWEWGWEWKGGFRGDDTGGIETKAGGAWFVSEGSIQRDEYQRAVFEGH